MRQRRVLELSLARNLDVKIRKARELRMKEQTAKPRGRESPKLELYQPLATCPFHPGRDAVCVVSLHLCLSACGTRTWNWRRSIRMCLWTLTMFSLLGKTTKLIIDGDKAAFLFVVYIMFSLYDRRGRQISSQVVGSHCAVAGNWTQNFGIVGSALNHWAQKC